MENFDLFFHGVAKMVDVVAMLMLTLGFARGVLGWVRLEIERESWERRIERVRKLRCIIATHILFALELMIVSDLIQTVLIIVEQDPNKGSFFSSPAFFELSQLAIVVVIRTFIDYFLSKEIANYEEPSLAD